VTDAIITKFFNDWNKIANNSISVRKVISIKLLKYCKTLWKITISIDSLPGKINIYNKSYE